MYRKSHTRTMCGTSGEKWVSTRDNAEIYIQSALFDNREGTPKIVASEISMMSTGFGASSLYR